MLVNGLKFDLRIYVALTCINPLRLYVYEDGLGRFATAEYSNDKGNKYVFILLVDLFTWQIILFRKNPLFLLSIVIQP